MLRIRRISKEYYLRQVMVCWLACCMLFVIPVQIAMAVENPVAGALPSGVIDRTGIDAPVYSPGRMDMTQTAGEAIVNWENFDIGSSATVEFHQPGATAAVLNRVHDGDVTGIMGTLTANGRVFVINPAGIVFGSGAHINVSQLVASSLRLDDDDFLNGLPYEFTEHPDFIGADDGIVTNESSDFQNAKRLYLIGRQVINRGHLVADECVIMAAGETVLISENSPVAVEVSMGAGWASGDDLYQVRNEDGDGIRVEGETAQVVLAAGDIWSAALVKAYSAGGPDAVATVDIDAAGDVLVEDEVIAEAKGNGKNNAVATVTVNSGGNVDVIAHAWIEDVGQGNVIAHEGKASIQAKTEYGATNTSEILICADGYVTVEAEGLWSKEDDLGAGSTASIQAIAQSGGEGRAQNNTADVQIDAKEGINVTAISKPYNTQVSASITAEAYNGEKNTANILTCSEGDVKVISEWDSVTPAPSTAYIKSVAGAYRELSSEAETTVISHKGNVVVDSSLGGNASIESQVYGGTADTATTQVYATDVKVIGVDASIKVTNNGSIKQRGDGYCMSDDGVVMEIGPDGSLIIDGSDSPDCPDCPPCPCDDEELFAPVAPLAKFEIPRIEGCPELMQAAAIELGITAETIQVAIGNALALNPSIQPCEACATLVDAVSILRDEDGSRMAAMVQVFNALAPADAPFTPEMATSIAMAFGGAAEGSQYASAMEYIDAFVQYATVLDIELGSPTGDSVAFVMEKYGAGITGSDNGNIAAFVATRLGAIGE